MTPKRKDWGESSDSRVLRKLLIRDRGYECQVCKSSQWMNLDIPLELDHIDGDADNNGQNNVRLLCPNCHSQTSNYKRKNKHHGSKRQISRMQRYNEGKTY